MRRLQASIASLVMVTLGKKVARNSSSRPFRRSSSSVSTVTWGDARSSGELRAIADGRDAGSDAGVVGARAGDGAGGNAVAATDGDATAGDTGVDVPADGGVPT